MTEPTRGALAPYRVLDLTGAMGALGARLLGDLGGDVIKVERPGGDPSRACPPLLDDGPDIYRSLPWLFANAGKRGISLALDTPAGRDLFLKLVARADFVFESLPPGYLESIHLGWDDLKAVNPALVMVRVSPYGQSGPYAGRPATDLTLWAMGGQMSLDGDADRAPLRPSAPQVDLLSGVHAAAGAMTAHHARRRSGVGQVVDVSGQECVTWTLMIAAQIWDISRINPSRGGAIRRARRADGSTIESRVIWPCKDGFIIWGLGGGSQGALESMRAIVGWMSEEVDPGPAAEVDWSTLSAATIDQETYNRITPPFYAFFARHTKRELFEGAIARNIQLAPVNEWPDIAGSPQLEARDYWCDIAHPALNRTLRLPGAPVKLSATPMQVTRPAPLPGEHNIEVFGGLLGLGADALQRLADEGVISNPQRMPRRGDEESN